MEEGRIQITRRKKGKKKGKKSRRGGLVKNIINGQEGKRGNHPNGKLPNRKVKGEERTTVYRVVLKKGVGTTRKRRKRKESHCGQQNHLFYYRSVTKKS